MAMTANQEYSNISASMITIDKDVFIYVMTHMIKSEIMHKNQFI